MGKLHDFFFFTSGERRGVCVLLLLVAVLTVVRVVLARAADDLPLPQGSDYPVDSLRSEETPPTVAPTVEVAGTVSKLFRKYEAPVLHIELNTADTLLLTELRGIGPGYARRIVGYRERLGGFYRPEQLLEVYGFTDELYDKIAAFVWVDPKQIKSLRVNALGAAQLKRHPYIGYYQAVALIAARDSAGGFLRSMHDIPLSRDLAPDDHERLSHYLSFE